MNSIPAPTPLQLAWQKKEFGLFCHFGINTFHNMEWSAGQLPPSSFAPGKLDAAQWVDTAINAGANYLILTAKHHDGFCLWPTQTTPYSVSNSPYKGDVVAEVSNACAAAGLAFGLYLLPWDRNCPVYDDAKAYDDFYCAQMAELCTRYGELFEIWLDGAGSEGRVYDWHRIMDVIDTNQPNAMVFNMGRPTIRWVGNEDGLAEDPCYYAVSSVPFSIYADEESDFIGASTGKFYIPPECDVPIRQNWFWQDDDLSTLKTAEHLLGIHYRSRGRGANLLLNVPPNRDGLLDENDCSRLIEVRAELDKRFASPRPARVRREGNGYAIEWDVPTPIDHLILQEKLDAGQYIDGFRVIDTELGTEISSGRTIGSQKWLAFPEAVTKSLRLELTAGTSEKAVLETATGYQTGYTELPRCIPTYDAAIWERKTNAKHESVPSWKP